MALQTAHDPQKIVERLRGKEFGSLAVASVRVENVEDADGLVTVVTVGLTSSPVGEHWDAKDFLAVRRFARETAFEVVGSGQELRMLYVEHQDSPEETPEPASSTGDKTGNTSL
jgi:hypothetical protein